MQISCVVKWENQFKTWARARRIAQSVSWPEVWITLWTLIFELPGRVIMELDKQASSAKVQQLLQCRERKKERAPWSMTKLDLQAASLKSAQRLALDSESNYCRISSFSPVLKRSCDQIRLLVLSFLQLSAGSGAKLNLAEIMDPSHILIWCKRTQQLLTEFFPNSKLIRH